MVLPFIFLDVEAASVPMPGFSESYAIKFLALDEETSCFSPDRGIQ